MNLKLTKRIDESIIEYDVVLCFYETSMEQVVVQLKQPKIYTKPEKTIYEAIIADDGGRTLGIFSMIMFDMYNITLDGNIINEQSLPFINNSFRFKVLE